MLIWLIKINVYKFSKSWWIIIPCSFRIPKCLQQWIWSKHLLLYGISFYHIILLLFLLLLLLLFTYIITNFNENFWFLYIYINFLSHARYLNIILVDSVLPAPLSPLMIIAHILSYSLETPYVDGLCLVSCDDSNSLSNAN